MDLKLDIASAEGYESHSQRVRIITESWTESNMFCPRCGEAKLRHFPNNRAVADFYCPSCKNEYELKSKKRSVGKKITDGAYSTFIQRITSNNNPDFFILIYDRSQWYVKDFLIVPKHFFTPKVVEKRNPLHKGRQRAGWIGCNILFSEIPEQGKISIIKDRIPVDQASVIAQVRKSNLLQEPNIEKRGWLFDILNCINQIPRDTFTLEEAYRFETKLKQLHPQNNNIRPKIRQQLQILRDKKIINFLGQGIK